MDLPIGFAEPPGFALARDFVPGHRVSGLYVDTRAGLIFSRVTGTPLQLATNYSVAGQFLGVKRKHFALSTAYPKQNFMGGAWNGPLVAHVQGPGYLADPTLNPNGKACCLIWVPGEDDEPRAMAALPADAPPLWGCTKSGIMFCGLMPWQAQRDGLVSQLFAMLAEAEQRLTGRPLDAQDVFIVMGPGARIGFSLDDERAYPYAKGGGEIFAKNIKFVDPNRLDAKERLAPWDLTLSDLGHNLLTSTTINGYRLNPRQVILDPRCTLTDPNSHSKRVMDAQRGPGVFATGPEPTCLFGGSLVPTRGVPEEG